MEGFHAILKYYSAIKKRHKWACSCTRLLDFKFYLKPSHELSKVINIIYYIFSTPIILFQTKENFLENITEHTRYINQHALYSFFMFRNERLIKINLLNHNFMAALKFFLILCHKILHCIMLHPQLKWDYILSFIMNLRK